MQNKKKWLAVGGITLVLLAVIGALVLNQGGLFSGNLTNIATFTKSINPEKVDAASEAKLKGLSVDEQVYSFTDAKDGTNYSLFADKTQSGAFGLVNDAYGKPTRLTLDVSKLNGQDLFLRLDAQQPEVTNPLNQSTALDLQKENVSSQNMQLLTPTKTESAAVMTPVTTTTTTTTTTPAVQTTNLQENTATPAVQTNAVQENLATPAIQTSTTRENTVTPAVQTTTLKQNSPTLIIPTTTTKQLNQSSTTIVPPSASLLKVAYALANSAYYKFTNSALNNNGGAGLVLGTATIPLTITGAGNGTANGSGAANGNGFDSSVYTGTVSQQLHATQELPAVFGVTFENNQNSLGNDVKITSLNFKAQIKSDSTTYQDGKDNSNGSLVHVNDIISQYTIKQNDVDPGVHANLDQAGNLTFSGLDYHISADKPLNLVIYGDKVSASAVYQTPVNFKFLLTSATYQNLSGNQPLFTNGAATNNSVIMSIPAVPAAVQADPEVPVTQTFQPTDHDVKLLSLKMVNLSQPTPQTITEMTFAAQVSADGTDNYSPTASAGIAVNKVIDPLYITSGSFTSAQSIDLSDNGEVTFTGLSIPVGPNITLVGKQVSSNSTYQHDVKVKYYLKNAKLQSNAGIINHATLANARIAIVPHPATTTPCIHIDSADFTKSSVTSIGNTSANNFFTTYNGTPVGPSTEVGIVDGICTPDFVNLGIAENSVGFQVKLTDGNQTTYGHFLLKNLSVAQTMFNGYLTVVLDTTNPNKPELKFTTDFTKNPGFTGALADYSLGIAPFKTTDSANPDNEVAWVMGTFATKYKIINLGSTPVNPTGTVGVVASIDPSATDKVLTQGSNQASTIVQLTPFLFKNLSATKDEQITKITIGNLLKADGTDNFVPGASGGLRAKQLIDTLSLNSTPAPSGSIDVSGQVVFDNLHINVPHGQTVDLTLLGAKLLKSPQDRPVLQHDAVLKYYLKDFQLADATTPVTNNAKADATTPKPPLYTIKQECQPIDKIAFTYPLLTYNPTSSFNLLFNYLSAYNGSSEIGFADNICASSLLSVGFDNNTVGFLVELKDSHGNRANAEVRIKNNAVQGSPFMNEFLPLELINNSTKPQLKFTNNFTKNPGVTLTPGEDYVVNAYGLAVDDSSNSDTAPAHPTTNPVAHYNIHIVAPANTNNGGTTDPNNNNNNGGGSSNNGGGTTIITNNYYSTTTTTPSTVPCIVNGVPYYNAGGPNSTYCLNLQSAINTTTNPPSYIFQSDLTPETPLVRYTAAKGVQNALNPSSLKTRNLGSNWCSSLKDCSYLKSLLTQEQTDSKDVFSHSILTGRLSLNGDATLAPLDRVTYAETLSLLSHAVHAANGSSGVVKSANLPSFLLKLYQENPKDYTWIAVAYSDAVDWKIVSKNQFTFDELFYSLPARGNFVDLLAKFSATIKARPSILQKN